MKPKFDSDLFVETPLIGIVRLPGQIDYASFIQAVIDGGLGSIEVSFTYPEAAQQLAGMVSAARGRINVGAGTVTTMDRLAAAQAAGASFIVTPGMNQDVAQAARVAELPFFPGAYTPTEVLAARAMGAMMVKLFPAVTLGPAFVKQMKSAMPDVPLLPTGGIQRDTIFEWHRAGADGLGLGGGLFPAAMVAAGNWDALAAHIRLYITEWRRPLK